MKVENRSIDYIPEHERHGLPRSLFFVWFGANANITTVAAGVLPVSLGLNLFWSVLSILLGSMIGAIFMASHSAQGPRLGIPQMIQSRAQFGVFGAIVPLLFVMLIYLGFSSAIPCWPPRRSPAPARSATAPTSCCWGWRASWWRCSAMR
ncbi:hypothetical protein GCM10011247_16250 [Pseudomonas plecoglossicida]|nr:hypothetical protein GCM10011247_16250 [Pseudomonas plecoglossicida]